jgi:hypothetical protein
VRTFSLLRDVSDVSDLCLPRDAQCYYILYVIISVFLFLMRFPYEIVSVPMFRCLNHKQILCAVWYINLFLYS